MRLTNLSLAFGMLLCTGVAMAQSPGPSNASQPNAGIAAQSAPSSDLGAQPARHHDANPARAAKHLGKQLGLTPDQVAQLKPILAGRQQAIQSTRSDATLAPRDRRAKVQGIMQDSRNKIEALLNDQQKQQFEQMFQDRRAQHRHPPQAQ